MRKEPVFLRVDQVLEIHRRAIEEHGGTYELRDRGLLESAVSMPGASFGGQFLHDGIPAMAAAYLFHLCKNHAFVDGNKRVAAAAAEIFIELNGSELRASDDEFEALTVGVADGSISKDGATRFFQARVKRKRRRT